MNIDPVEALDLRKQMDDVEDRTEQLEKQMARLLADEFISAGVWRRGLVVVGYWLFGAFSVAGVAWVVTMVWGWM